MSRRALINRVLKHCIFWLSFFGTLFVFTGLDALNKNFILIDLPITLVYSYTVAYLIIPFFLSGNRLLYLIFSIFALSILLSWIRLLNYDYLYYSIYSSKLAGSEMTINFPTLLLNAKDFSFGMIIFLATKYTVNWLQTENREIKIELEQLETEVKILKTQVDPHFLFNTMNNLYSLSVSRNPDIRQKIKKMWGLMDFMIRETGMKEVRLDKEIQMISDYVELERMRYGDRLDFQMKLTGNLRQYRIPPMILYPVVENCFKHGCAGDPNYPWIMLSITEMSDRIKIVARNSYPCNEHEIKGTGLPGTGIDNIRKRLQYQLPGRYKLNIEKKTGVYEVILDIFY